MTTTGLPAAQERAWLEAWSAARDRWTLDDLRGACRWLEAGGYLCGTGRVTPAALAKHLEDWLQRAHGDDWQPRKGRRLVAEAPEGVATNFDEITRRMKR